MRFPTFCVVLLAVSGCLTACNDSSNLAGGKKSDSKDDTEDENADIPVSVSGAYLTCDWLEPESNDENTTTLIGCSVVDRKGKAFERTDRNFNLTLHNNDDSPSDMTTADTSEESPWHKLAALPGSHRETGYLKMSMGKGAEAEGSFLLNTVDIGNNVTLGNQFAGEPIPLENASGLALKEITTHGQWDAGAAGFAAGSINPNDYCDTGGKLRTSLRPGSELLVLMANGLVKSETTTTTIVHSDKKFILDSEKCFVPFKVKSNKVDEYAQQSNDGQCLFLQHGNSIQIISVPKAANPDMTLENLKEFAAKKACI